MSWKERPDPERRKSGSSISGRKLRDRQNLCVFAPPFPTSRIGEILDTFEGRRKL